MVWYQTTVSLKARSRGFHLVTREIVDAMPDLDQVEAGLLHVFLQHTSASLTINENASPDVRGDMERHFNEMVPEEQPYYEHTIEGPDDMPAHIKAALLDTSLTIPIRNGELVAGHLPQRAPRPRRLPLRRPHRHGNERGVRRGAVGERHGDIRSSCTHDPLGIGGSADWGIGGLGDRRIGGSGHSERMKPSIPYSLRS